MFITISRAERARRSSAMFRRERHASDFSHELLCRCRAIRLIGPTHAQPAATLSDEYSSYHHAELSTTPAIVGLSLDVLC